MPGNPHECREHAKNCLRLADEGKIPEAKTHFENIAHQWMKLATDLEQTSVLMAQWGPKKKRR